MAGKFFSTLRDLRNGRTLDDLDSAIGEVVSAVKSTGKTAEIVLKLKVRPPKKAGSVQYLTIEDQVVKKIPENDRGDTVFFPTADNSLTRNDPTQIALNLRPVESVSSEGEIAFANTQGAN